MKWLIGKKALIKLNTVETKINTKIIDITTEDLLLE